MDNDILIPYRKKDKWGFCTPDKKIVIECTYEEVGRFIGRLAEVRLERKWGITDRQGNNFVPCVYDWIKIFSNELIIVGLNGKSCFLDMLGDDIVFKVYDYHFVERFNEGLAKIKMNGKYGFCDEQGNILIPCRYDWVGTFDDGIAIIQINKKYSLIDKSGSIISNNLYDNIYEFDKDCAVVVLSEKEGLIDRNGNEIIPCIYSWVKNLSRGVAEIYSNDEGMFFDKINGREFNFSFDTYLMGYMDDAFPSDWNNEEKEEFIICYMKEYPERKRVLEQEYGGNLFDNLGKFKEGVAWIKYNDKYGFIDEKYEEVIPLKYYNAGNFSEGLAFVSNKRLKEVYRDTENDDVQEIEFEGNYGFINKNGKEVIPCKYDLAFDFEGGLAKVEINDLLGFIDKNGTEYWED